MDFRELAAGGPPPIIQGARWQAPPDGREGERSSAGTAARGSCMPGGQLPSHVPVWLDGRDLSLPIHPLGDGLGRVILPCLSEGTASGQQDREFLASHGTISR